MSKESDLQDQGREFYRKINSDKFKNESKNSEPKPSKKRNVDWSNDLDDMDSEDWESHHDPYTPTHDKE